MMGQEGNEIKAAKLRHRIEEIDLEQATLQHQYDYEKGKLEVERQSCHVELAKMEVEEAEHDDQ